MTETRNYLRGAAAALALAGLAGPALAGGSVKDDPAPEGRKFTYSWNIGATTDYVFRGVSQSAEKPAFQIGADIGYGIFYAGVWGSTIDFGDNLDGTGIAVSEIDWYAGIKPTWGPLTFDLGVIYYSYPGAKDDFPANGNHLFRELDYVELKGGVSGSPVQNMTTGLTVFYSPEYTSKQGAVWTVEGAASYTLPKTWIFTPTIGGLIGYQAGDFSLADFGAGNATFVAANGADDYIYWNVGLALAVDKLTLDFRYWDTDIANNSTATGFTNFCKGATFQCDERFVFSAKITF